MARELGTSMRMIKGDYAGVMARNGKRVPVERQIRTAHRASGRDYGRRPLRSASDPFLTCPLVDWQAWTWRASAASEVFGRDAVVDPAAV